MNYTGRQVDYPLRTIINAAESRQSTFTSRAAGEKPLAIARLSSPRPAEEIAGAAAAPLPPLLSEKAEPREGRRARMLNCDARLGKKKRRNLPSERVWVPQVKVGGFFGLVDGVSCGFWCGKVGLCFRD